MRSDRERASSPSALGRRARPVWVDLRVLFPTATDPSRVPAGVVVDEAVAGGLWDWVCISGGEWLGVATLHLCYRDGRPDRRVAERQLVPAHALRPR